jgi:hypothetical protein
VRIALLLAALLAAGGFKARGFALPDGAVRVDEDRYRLPQTWEETLRWYRTVYPPAKYPRSTLRNQSGVRALHIDNPGGSEWEGANLYETARGEVRVFVLAVREPEPVKPTGKVDPKSK